MDNELVRDLIKKRTELKKNIRDLCTELENVEHEINDLCLHGEVSSNREFDGHTTYTIYVCDICNKHLMQKPKNSIITKYEYSY